MHRVFVPPDAIQHRTITITNPSDVHHLLRVLRVKVGEPLTCLSAGGQRYQGTITQCSPQRLTVDVTEIIPQRAVSSTPITLAQALLPPDRFEWIIEKSTELGAARLIPMMTSRTIVRLTDEQTQRKQVRWERIATAAAAQSGNTEILQIESPQSFSQVMEHAGAQAIMIPTLSVETVPLNDALNQIGLTRPLLVCIGPEGDFTPGEVQRAIDVGAHAVSLGPLTLRSETAAIASLAILQHHLRRRIERS